MTDQPQVKQGSGQQYDNPNQEVVRGDGSGPADEGSGGSERVDPEPSQQPATATETDLDAMTKDELLEHAKKLGVSPANNAMTKEELRAGVDAKLAEG